MSEVTFKVESVDRIGTTYQGNPRFTITDTEGNTYRVSDNAACTYSVDNYRPRKHLNQYYKITAKLTKAGRIEHITKAEEL